MITRESELRDGSGAKPVLNLVLIAVLVASCCIWLFSAHDAWNELDSRLYAKDSVFGVKLSKFSIVRGITNTHTFSSAYAGFLQAAVRLIGENPEREAFTEAALSPNIELAPGTGLRPENIIPATNGDYLLGIQRDLRIAIAGQTSFDRDLQGRWVEMHDAADRTYRALIVGGDGNALTLRGDIPLWYFPDHLTVPRREASRGQSFSLVASHNSGNSVRGGLAAGSATAMVHLFHPFWHWLQDDSPASPGDTLIFPDGRRQMLRRFHYFDGQYLAEVPDLDVRPYFDMRRNILTVMRKNRPAAPEIKLSVAPLNNDEFINGRARHVRILMTNRAGTTGRATLLRPLGDQILRADLKKDGAAQIDLKASVAAQMCMHDRKTTGGENPGHPFIAMAEAAGPASAMECLDENSATHRAYGEVLTGWAHLPEKTRRKIENFLRDQYPTSPKEVLYNSLDYPLLVVAGRNSAPSPRTARKQRDPSRKIWELYPGSMLNIYYGESNPAPEQFLLHAIGDEKAGIYLREFLKVKPAYVAFAKPKHSTQWLINWHWPFFEALILNYREIHSNSDFALWQRKEGAWARPAREETALKPGHFPATLDIATTETGDEAGACALALANIEVAYRVDNPFAILPLIGRSDRFLISATGRGAALPVEPPVTLPPRSGRFSFPVVYRAGAMPKLALERISPFWQMADIEIEAITVSPVPAAQAEIRSLFLENTPYKLIADRACAEGGS